MVATRFRGIGARQVFPCWDEPEFTATFRIGIKHHSNYTVLSNTPIFEMDPIATILVWRMFNVTPAIPTHLMAFTMFDPMSIYSFSDNILSPSHLTFAQNFYKLFINSTTSYLKSNWNILKNLEEYLEEVHHIAIPNFPNNAISNWRLNFYR